MTSGGDSSWIPPEVPAVARTPVDHLLQPAVPVVPTRLSPKRPRWLVPTIVASVLVVVAVAVGAVLAVANWLFSPDDEFNVYSYTPDQKLTAGSPASPFAAEPLICPPACFSAGSVPSTIVPKRAFEDLGLPDEVEPYGTYPETTVGWLYGRDAGDWREFGARPDACFFAPSSAPYASSLNSEFAGNKDPIVFTGTHVDRFDNVADQAVRLFPDSAAAEAYMADLANSIAQCTRVQFGSGRNLYTADVALAASVNPPKSIAAVGWIRTGDPGVRWRAYVFDVQRANLVIRIRVLSDGSIREQDFRRVVQFAAAQLASIPTVEVGVDAGD